MSIAKNLSLIIATNQFLIQEGILNILSYNSYPQITIDTVINKEELHKKIMLSTVHILIIDIESFDLGSVMEVLDIKKIVPAIKMLIIVNEHFFHDDLFKIVDYENISCIPSSCEKHDFIEAFNATVSGNKYFNYQLINELVTYKKTHNNIPEKRLLTSTEIEIIGLVLLGFTSQEIATTKQSSVNTINTHLKNIFRKLKIKNRFGLIKYIIDSDTT